MRFVIPIQYDRLMPDSERPDQNIAFQKQHGFRHADFVFGGHMQFETILVTLEHAVAIVRLNHAKARKALSSRRVRELSLAFTILDREPAAEAIVLTGAGSHFAASADLKEVAAMTTAAGLADDFAGSCEALAETRTPVIAAVEGHALGGDCERVEMCDVVIASETVTFGHPKISVGTFSGCGGTQRLSRIVGKHWAMNLLLARRFLSAIETYRCGLVSRPVPAERLPAEVPAVTQQIVSLSMPAVRTIKAAVLRGLDVPLPVTLVLERALFDQTFAFDDHVESITAFIENRPPHFRDR